MLVSGWPIPIVRLVPARRRARRAARRCRRARDARARTCRPAARPRPTPRHSGECTSRARSCHPRAPKPGAVLRSGYAPIGPQSGGRTLLRQPWPERAPAVSPDGAMRVVAVAVPLLDGPPGLVRGCDGSAAWILPTGSVALSRPAGRDCASCRTVDPCTQCRSMSETAAGRTTGHASASTSSRAITPSRHGQPTSTTSRTPTCLGRSPEPRSEQEVTNCSPSHWSVSRTTTWIRRRQLRPHLARRHGR